MKDVVKLRVTKPALKWPYKKKLDPLIKKEIKTAIEHFKKDGWPLDYRLLESFILTDLMGHYSIYIIACLLEAVPGTEMVTDHRQILFRKKEKSIATKKRKG